FCARVSMYMHTIYNFTICFLESYLVPAKTVMVISIYDIYRDPNFWSNPEIFNRDRFLPENIQNRHSCSYIPFSVGPRNCIGHRFAMLKIKAFITSLIHNFYLEPINYLKNLRLQANMILCSTLIHIGFVPVSKIKYYAVFTSNVDLNVKKTYNIYNMTYITYEMGKLLL
ncbi:C4AC1 protein, partial [Pseudoatta argentina]